MACTTSVKCPRCHGHTDRCKVDHQTWRYACPDPNCEPYREHRLVFTICVFGEIGYKVAHIPLAIYRRLT